MVVSQRAPVGRLLSVAARRRQCVRRVPAARFGEPAATALDAAQVGEAFQPDRLPTSDFAAGSAPRIAGLAATPCVSHGAPGTTRLSGTGLSDSGRRSATAPPRQSSIQSSPWTANMRNLPADPPTNLQPPRNVTPPTNVTPPVELDVAPQTSDPGLITPMPNDDGSAADPDEPGGDMELAPVPADDPVPEPKPEVPRNKLPKQRSAQTPAPGSARSAGGGQSAERLHSDALVHSTSA